MIIQLFIDFDRHVYFYIFSIPIKKKKKFKVTDSYQVPFFINWLNYKDIGSIFYREPGNIK